MGDKLFWIIGFPALIFCIFGAPLLFMAFNEMSMAEMVLWMLGFNLFGGFLVGLSGQCFSPLLWLFWIPALLSEKVRNLVIR